MKRRYKVYLNGKIVTGLDRLGLKRKYSAVILKESESVNGMIKNLESFIAYGKIGKETLKELLIKRGRLPGDKAIKKDIDKLVEEIMAGKGMKELGLKPLRSYRMTYTEYLLRFVGYTRAYFSDYVKFRAVAYQSYCTNNAKPVSIEKYMPLPYVDSANKIDLEKEIAQRKRFLKDGK